MKLSLISCASFMALAGIAVPAGAAFATQAPKQPQIFEIVSDKQGVHVTNAGTLDACAHATVTNFGDIGRTAHEGTVSHNGAVTARTDSQRGVWKAPAGMTAKPCYNGKGKAGKHEPTMQPAPQPK